MNSPVDISATNDAIVDGAFKRIAWDVPYVASFRDRKRTNIVDTVKPGDILVKDVTGCD